MPSTPKDNRFASAGAEAGPVDPEERIDVLLRHLATRPAGLTEREADRRLEQHGPNELERAAGRRWLPEIRRQLTHPLALLLWIAATLSLASGNQALAIAIVAVILVNAGLAFVQEQQAERATEALSELLPATARVRRGGRQQEIPARDLVPGDLLLLEEGDRLSADARLVAGAVELDMSPLTGESQPVIRSAEPTRRSATLLEAHDLVFAGSLCSAGEASAVVYATAGATQVGRIAALTQRVGPEISPLQAQVNRAAWVIAAIGVTVAVLFFVVGITIAGLSLAAAVTFAIGLLVANVPEGLLPIITLSLAGGVRRMAARGALVKRLTAVETLGSTDVICTDKTGTLTEGRMRVKLLWASGETLAPDEAAPRAGLEPFSALLRTAVRCNNASAHQDGDGWRRGGDPTESALLVAAAEMGEDVEAAQRDRERLRRRLFHFDAHLKRMTTLDSEPDDRHWLHAKGAPLELLATCSTMRIAGGDRSLTEADRRNIEAAFKELAGRGLRVLGFAERPLDGADEPDRARAEAGLVFLGLIALEDPPRAQVAGAVESCRAAGIRIIVVTGDHALTAEAIARQVGIVTGSATVLSGAEVEAMNETELDAVIGGSPELIIARSNPETKLEMVDALRARGHTVAMTGDGVNDAPALRRADIGVAMGASGTDVAREAATMVLTDDDFTSIVAAVERGRAVYDNIRKFVTYIFVHAVPEVAPFVLFAISGGAIPPPLTALQILAIDLGTDTVPALALGREPAEPGIMARPPRPREVGIINTALLKRAWLRLGVVEALLVLGGFFYVLLTSGWGLGDDVGAGTALHQDYLRATTMLFAGIVSCQIGAAFAVRTTTASLAEIGVFSNPALLRGIAFEILFAAAIVYLPPLQSVFATAGLQPADLAILACFPFIVWGSDELHRAWRRRRAALR